MCIKEGKSIDSIETYVRRVQQGETETFAHIVRAFQQPLHVYCLRMLGCRHEAEDAVQDILVQAFEKIGGYRPEATFSA